MYFGVVEFEGIELVYFILIKIRRLFFKSKELRMSGRF